ncbi:hypothetical protein FSARC_5545 [Fusarium sarcochroum]|uniref:MARVEL domain-containing protein n=1 Tax=Fusarium sarcochroum TaxID=1208366 RepID=A0A8H4XA28_9HYPO|nr:hypothetical protein FSARC_5545 [Fusarium sarcochroum]
MVPTFLKRMEPFFTLRNKIPLQIVQVILIITVIALSGARLVMPNRPPGRSTTMGLGMGAKSLIILSYEILTEHFSRFQRWGSLKAYFILNTMEVVFWAAVAFMMIRGNTNTCVGASCALGWVVFVLAGILSPMYKYLAVVSFLDWRFFKKNGFPRSAAMRKDSEESLSTLRSDNLPETAYGH